MQTCCLKRKNVLHTSNGRTMFSAHCTVCNSEKSSFIKKATCKRIV